MSASGEINHDQQEPNGLIIYISIAATTIALIVVVFFSLIFYKSTRSDIVNARLNTETYSELRDIQLYEAEILGTSKWLNKAKTKARLSIEDAKAYTLKTYSN